MLKPSIYIFYCYLSPVLQKFCITPMHTKQTLYIAWGWALASSIALCGKY